MRYKSYVESHTTEHLYHFTTIPCPLCEGEAVLTVKAPDLFRYNQGALMQDAFPYLAPADRERFMSGICGGCFGGNYSCDECGNDYSHDEVTVVDGRTFRNRRCLNRCTSWCKTCDRLYFDGGEAEEEDHRPHDS